MKILNELPEGIVMPANVARQSGYADIYKVCKKMEVGNVVCLDANVLNSTRTLKHNITNIKSCIGKHFDELAESYKYVTEDDRAKRALKVAARVEAGETLAEAEIAESQVLDYVKPTFTLFIPEGRTEIWMGRKV